MKAKRIITCIISCILFMMCIPFTATAEADSYIDYITVYSTIDSSTLDLPVRIFCDGTIRADSDFDNDGQWIINPNVVSSPLTTENYWNKQNDELYAQLLEIMASNTVRSSFPVEIQVGRNEKYNSVSITIDNKYTLENGSTATYKLVRNVNIMDGWVSNRLLCKIDIVYCNGNGYLRFIEADDQDIIISGTNFLENNLYREITYNNGSSAIRFKTDTDVSNIQKYIEELEAENATLRQENTELKNRINLLATGTYGDVNGDEIVDVQDAQIILKYYTMKDVAGIEVPDLVTFGMNFGKE